MDSKRLKCLRFKRFKKRKSILPVSDQQESAPRRTFIDPRRQFLLTWNKIFMLSCVISMALDPLFFYIPVIHDKDKCLDSDLTLAKIACVLRSLFDAFYVLHIIFQFRTGFTTPYSLVFGLGEPIADPVAIAKRYLSTYFLIDILSILPLPQVLVFITIPSIKTQAPLFMKLVIFSQYVPRITRICILYREETRTSGMLIQPWTGAAYNLFLYMLASHVLGAFWYLCAIEREETCWQKHCKNSTGCEDKDFYCGDYRNESFAHLYYECPFIKPDDIENTTVFNFGMFTDVLKSGMVETKDFQVKLFYCFWWGFRSLGSLGQNLQTSTSIGEMIFAIFISTFGLVLFSFLIGNMQRYLQSTSVRIEEMTQVRVERTGVERWMSHRMLPKELRARVRRYQQYKWQLTRGVEEENLLQRLPKDLRRDITRHMCLNLLKRVPMFEQMDSQLFDALCDRLKPVLHTEKSCIILEGDPVDEMLFIMRGTLTSMTAEPGYACNLKAGDFCGEELIAWALNPRSSTSLPISTRTVIAQTEVQAFALWAADLKFVASQFRHFHSKQFQHIFRFYSLQWRKWAARRIQAAWLRYHERKLYKSLYEAEDGLQDGVTDEAGTSKVEHNGERKAPKRLLLLPKKPDEPNFYYEDY
ncbi:putative cyclic nucleotide-gated ion channel 10 [Castanea sativa]|uniref:putative cyclic nucleotide-gated ion channel 10 n=1 Tax=Castanea sativa TaxID=21020 RepID=UPI003F65004C